MHFVNLDLHFDFQNSNFLQIHFVGYLLDDSNLIRYLKSTIQINQFAQRQSCP